MCKNSSISNPKRWCCGNAFYRSAKLESSAVATGLAFTPIPKKGNSNECSNYHKDALISNAIKLMLTLLQARFQKYINCELPHVQTGFRKARGNKGQISYMIKYQQSKRASEKTAISTLLAMPKPFTVWMTLSCVEFWKGWKYQTTWPASWETCTQVTKQQLELGME